MNDGNNLAKDKEIEEWENKNTASITSGQRNKPLEKSIIDEWASDIEEIRKEAAQKNDSN